MAGEARAILAKAEVVAREAGVSHASFAMTSNRPYEAILDVAEAQRLRPDLHRLAGHRGIKGLMLGSQTQKVLQHATIPVLVSSVESNIAPRSDDGAARDHRRRASIARGGRPRPRIPGSRNPRGEGTSAVRPAPRDRSHTSRRSPRSCTIRRKTPTCSPGCAGARPNSTARWPSSNGSTPKGTG